MNKVKLSEACTINPPKSEVKGVNDLDVSFVPMADLNENKISFEPTQVQKIQDVYKGYTYFKNEDVLLAKVTPCFENGKAGVAKDLVNGIGFGSSEFIVLRPKDFLLPEYLYYSLCTSSFRMEGANNMSGAVGLKRLTKDFLLNYEIPIPKLSEQRQIVAILDKLLMKVDKAIILLEENLTNTKHLLDSILNNVFNDLSDRYENQPLHYCSKFKNGYAFKSGDFNTDSQGLQVIRIGNVLNLDKNPVFIQEKDDYKKSKLDVGDLVISMTGTRGKKDYLFVSIIDKSQFYLNQRVGAITPNQNTSTKFLYYYLKTSLFRDKVFEFETGSVNQGNISGKDIMNSLIPLPTLEVQEDIVRYLSSLNKKQQSLLKEQESRLKALRALKESILNAAFKGELSKALWEAISKQSALVD
ncbi:restriction endonuclease subunit S [Pontibacter pudoricolor]|uniref:restriction endonuclease subunit S n=1 Tax=Pontibacter pudoricolor TaxID=2694930 RepID=UPI0013913BAE|nr:restriction endonuclease subunit S [Pontibacter pudoricolor]